MISFPEEERGPTTASSGLMPLTRRNLGFVISISNGICVGRGRRPTPSHFKQYDFSGGTPVNHPESTF